MSLEAGVNISKTVICDVEKIPVSSSEVLPCTVHNRSIDNNSILCIVCGDWVHKIWSNGLKGALANVTDFNCSVCNGSQIMESRMDSIAVGN